MKQETGNNQAPAANKVSIQQSLDGHSFSVAGLDAEFPGDDRIKVVVLSAQTMLVPKELFAATSAHEPAPTYNPSAAESDTAAREAQGVALLAANGMAPGPGMRVVWSDPTAEAMAIMTLHREAYAQVHSRIGTRAGFTTPLLFTPAVTNKVVWICIVDGLLYIKVYDNALRLAEVISTTTDADIIYLFERLSTEFPLAKFRLRITGDKTQALRKTLGKRFKSVTCE